MQSVSSRIWTRIAVSISCDDMYLPALIHVMQIWPCSPDIKDIYVAINSSRPIDDQSGVGMFFDLVRHVCADLVGCVVSLATEIGRSWLTLTSFIFRRLFPQAITLLVRTRFITWGLRRPFFGECRRGPRHFWSRMTCATLIRLVGRTTNTSPELSHQVDTTYGPARQ